MIAATGEIANAGDNKAENTARITPSQKKIRNMGMLNKISAMPISMCFKSYFVIHIPPFLCRVLLVADSFTNSIACRPVLANPFGAPATRRLQEICRNLAT